ncbi:MAG: succinate dehydrogenase cytochrome b558 subunit [Planctomycetota bacterium]
MSEVSSSASFFLRHEFAIRRLHSLLGIIPLGAYMVVHLTTNASLISGTETFQRAVIIIHSLGDVLPLVEWGAIFLPLLFHAILGVWIVKTGKSNSGQYKFTSNKRYVWQRWTGLIAFAFLMVHVLHLHGWFHVGPWLALVEPLGMAGFRPYNAASTLMKQMDGYIWPTFYLIGVLACVYHLANGLWTAGITWGLWISPEGQDRASKVAVAFGAVLAVIGTTAWWAAVRPADYDAVQQVEDSMYEANLETGWAYDKPHKRSHDEDDPADDSGETAALIPSDSNQTFGRE